MQSPALRLTMLLCVFMLPLKSWAVPFEPNVESLSQYVCAEWFRDAKFGRVLRYLAVTSLRVVSWFTYRFAKS